MDTSFGLSLIAVGYSYCWYILLYQYLYYQITTQIINDDLIPNPELPYIRAAAKELRISIIIFKKAFKDLESDCYIQTITGKGSYESFLTLILIEKKWNS